MTSNNRKPAPTKTEAVDKRMPVRCYKAVCVITVIAMVLLVASGCSGSSGDSRQLAEYISGTAYYGEVYSSDADAPKRVAMESVFSLPYSGMDSRISRAIEGKDKFVLELRNSSGRTLRSVDFYAEKYTSHGDPVEPNPNENYGSITYAEFKVIVEDPPNYATLAILHDGNEIVVVERSSNAPSVSISGPAEGQVFYDGDSVPLGLKVADADGDVLDYRVYFSTDGGDSYEVFSEKYALRIPAVSLDSSTQARLAVSVSDGARASFVETEIFTVAERTSVETTIAPVYLPPRAYDDTIRGYVGEPLRIYVLSNDIYSETDFNWQSLKIDIPPSSDVAYVSGETVEIMRPPYTEWVRTFRPFITYIPSSAGIDTLTYSICDSNDQCDSAQVTITSIVNQPPIANNDMVGGDIGEVLRIDVLANDIDAERDFDYESLSIDVPPIFGTASVKSELIPVGDSKYFAKHNSGDTQSTSSPALKPLILKHSDIGSRQNVSTPPTIPSILKYFIEYRYAYTAIDSLTYSICDTFDQCDTAEVTIKAGTADCTIVGTEQDDTLEGTPGDDVICGLGGNDTIHAGGGDDIIKAGLGDDTVFAGPGDDIVRGGGGNDDITGDNGADELYGGLGDDTLDGGDGDDIIHGSKGDDIIYGGPGDDTIRGNLGADTIYPGEGNDTLEGSTEPDTIIQ